MKRSLQYKLWYKHYRWVNKYVMSRQRQLKHTPWHRQSSVIWKQYKDFNCYRLHVWNHWKLLITREIISKLRMAGYTNISNTVTVVICVFAETWLQKGIIMTIYCIIYIYQDASCNWSSSNFVCRAILMTIYIVYNASYQTTSLYIELW
jgi:hypothetical protein